MIELLDDYRDGLTEEEAVQDVTGDTRIALFTLFKQWAEEQIGEWGMKPTPSIGELMDELAHDDSSLGGVVDDQAEANAARMNESVVMKMMLPRSVLLKAGMVKDTKDKQDSEVALSEVSKVDTIFPTIPKVYIPSDLLTVSDVDRWLARYPAQPDVIMLRLQKSQGDSSDMTINLLERYQEARPVDPMPLRRLADYYLHSGQEGDAVPYLEELDRRTQYTGSFAIELARIYRGEKNYHRALAKAHRALIIEPFNANYRELAAAIALQKKDYQEARHQLVALTIIEPGRVQHQKRLEALERLERGLSGP